MITKWNDLSLMVPVYCGRHGLDVYSILEVVTVQRMATVDSGEIYRHLGTGSMVFVKDVNKDGSVTWESLSRGDLIEGHSWGKMQGVPFLEQFRSVKDSADMVADIRTEQRSKHVVKPN